MVRPLSQSLALPFLSLSLSLPLLTSDAFLLKSPTHYTGTAWMSSCSRSKTPPLTRSTATRHSTSSTRRDGTSYCCRPAATLPLPSSRTILVYGFYTAISLGTPQLVSCGWFSYVVLCSHIFFPKFLFFSFPYSFLYMNCLMDWLTNDAGLSALPLQVLVCRFLNAKVILSSLWVGRVRLLRRSVCAGTGENIMLDIRSTKRTLVFKMRFKSRWVRYYGCGTVISHDRA